MKRLLGPTTFVASPQTRKTATHARRPATPPATGPAAHRQRQRQRQRRPTGCRAAQASSEAAQLLDDFWLARGVVDEQQRRQLVAAAGSLQAAADDQEEEYAELELPSMSAAWFLEQGQESTAVAAVSRRILALKQLLGGGKVDVVWMLVREPRLLSADFRSIMQRLFDMKLADGSEGLDVVALVEQQPALLLAAAPAGGGGGGDDETAEQRLQAWQHGLVSDGAAEWARRFGELQAYAATHGDAHVGFRDGDDAELRRWAVKQRSDEAGGELAAERRQQLEAAGFEFDAERAEWLRWLTQIRLFQEREGHCEPHPLAHPNDFLLINWCSVQRIMRRCKVLPPDRVAALDALGFDWTGADPLS
ncbi:DEAD DEAH box helicase [Micractinium conductrix]|uniref:DEAD DEAH box helicase n=1 Tax=Micractinium conductrix TaxID=554055 RepID=A0A2P6VI68_9CHLO|nr:DEAD DEAH box helicase [Micractinium conductrix]|eukprot:PSC73793.1 DEAD DEAH box helicase [Micractinium conductrix]